LFLEYEKYCTYSTQSKDEQYPLNSFNKVSLLGGFCESCLYFISKHHITYCSTFIGLQ